MKKSCLVLLLLASLPAFADQVNPPPQEGAGAEHRQEHFAQAKERILEHIDKRRDCVQNANSPAELGECRHREHEGGPAGNGNTGVAGPNHRH